MYNKEYYHKNKERICARAKLWYAENKERLCARDRQRYAEIKANGKPQRSYVHVTRDESMKKRRARWKIRYRESKRAVLDHYGNTCACCGESNEKFLTLDHINGGGYEERRHNGDLWVCLVRRNFPDGYQILCYNCNCGRQQNGGVCPHKTSDCQENNQMNNPEMAKGG